MLLSFFFFFGFLKRTGCGEDGRMDAIVFYFDIQMAEMLHNVASKKFPLYIYIYKLKIITLMQ